jgi:hypothetical protein
VGGDLHEALKAWISTHGGDDGRDYIEVKSAKGRYAVGWRKNKTGGGKTFGAYIPETSDRAPRDDQLDDVFSQVAERAREARSAV